MREPDQDMIAFLLCNSFHPTTTTPPRSHNSREWRFPAPPPPRGTTTRTKPTQKYSRHDAPQRGNIKKCYRRKPPQQPPNPIQPHQPIPSAPHTPTTHP